MLSCDGVTNGGSPSLLNGFAAGSGGLDQRDFAVPGLNQTERQGPTAVATLPFHCLIDYISYIKYAPSSLV